MSIVIHIFAIIGALFVVALFGAIVMGAYALSAMGEARHELDGVEIDSGQVHDVDHDFRADAS